MPYAVILAGAPEADHRAALNEAAELTLRHPGSTRR